jgi:hypothetical protein
MYNLLKFCFSFLILFLVNDLINGLELETVVNGNAYAVRNESAR